MTLDMPFRSQGVGAPATETIVKEEGRYLYCIAEAQERVNLGAIGVAGNEVCTLPYKDLGAVVHPCPAQPYRSDDKEVVEAWLMAHQKVVEAAWERWGTVLPLSFNTIIWGEEGGPEQNLRAWLEEEYDSLKSKMDKVRGKAEYGVQVFWHTLVVTQKLCETSPAIKKLDEEIKTKPRGQAYLYRQRLEILVKREIEAKADECFRDFYHRIRKHTDDIRVEKTKKAEPGLQMILNLSCLVYKDKYKELGEELDQIRRREGFWVRFTGPWPPYSFVGSGG